VLRILLQLNLRKLAKTGLECLVLRGNPRLISIKFHCSYASGYSAVGTLTYSWPEALTKAKAADKILRKRLENLNLKFTEIRTEFVGYNACHGPLARKLNEDDINEIIVARSGEIG